ncbi:MAG TPA: SRPBCC family protein [Gaiellales bacterium]|jgi:uncharacterized protein YndB with AHSA1/START domain|nr:SRPBCC family protein [Gaiellales bacterium]
MRAADGEPTTTTFSTPSDRELAVTRFFAAPPALVFDAWTSPARIKDWMLGPDGWTMPVCDVDLRAGGAWRFAWRGPDGTELSMHGVYREVSPPERLVFTEAWGGDWPETLNTVVLAGEDDGTRLTCTVQFVSTGARAAAFSTGMSQGMTQSLDRLAEQLAARA